VPLSEYQAQGRGGKGKRAADLREEDHVRWLFVANTHDQVLILTDKGKVYVKKVYEIPAGSRASRGRHVNNFVGLVEGEESLASMLALESLDREDAFLLTCTKNGKVKRTALSAYANIRQSGLIAVQIEEGDQLLAARVVSEDAEVILGTSDGMSIRFAVGDVRPMGRDTRGVRGIDLRDGDHVIGMDVIEGEEQQVLAVSANGFGKRTPIREWRIQNRGGKGIIAMITSDRNGPLVKLRLVRPSEHIIVITSGGQIIRTRVHEIREAGRNTQGVRIIRVSEGEHVVDVEPVQQYADTDDIEVTTLPPPSPDDLEEEAALAAPEEPEDDGGPVPDDES
jgi:DNA gyrase subunit A